MSSNVSTAAPDPRESVGSGARIEPPCPSMPPLERLRRIVHLLRAPGGCPWDREQDHSSLVPLLLEEAYEVAEAVASGDDLHICEELGDLLLHVVMHGEMAEERGAFDLEAIARGVVEKMIRRHPHVFGPLQAGDSEAVLRQWDEIKRGEKSAGEPSEGAGPAREARPFLHGISHGLPGLIRAHKLQKRAAKAGFEFASVRDALDKVREELAEVEQELATGAERSGEAARQDLAALGAELGDLLFSVVNVTRLLGLDAETLLAATNRKFEARFGVMERLMRERGVSLAEADLDTMEAAWQQAKAHDRG